MSDYDLLLEAVVDALRWVLVPLFVIAIVYIFCK